MEIFFLIYFTTNLLTCILNAVVMGAGTANIVSFKENCKYCFEKCVLFPYNVFMYFIYDYNTFGSLIIAFLSLFVWAGVLFSGLPIFVVTSVIILFNFLFKRKETN